MWLAPMFRNRPGRDPNQPRWKFTVLALVAVTSFLALLPFIYTGVFSRYQADDYCSAQLLRSSGFLNAQWESYTGWSNRFSTMFITGLIDPLDVLGMQILPTILVVGLLLCGYYLLHTLRLTRGWSLSDLELIALAGVITFTSVYSAPNAFQSIYWRSGSITYTLPILGFLILAAILVSQMAKNPTGWKVVLIGLLAFFNGGFSETTVVMQLALLGMAAGWLLWRLRKGETNYPGKATLWAAIAGTILAMLVMILSPGNAIRLSQMPAPPDFFRWLYLIFRFGAGFIYQTITSYPVPLLATVIIGFALSQQRDWHDAQPTKWSWAFWAIPTVVFLVIVASCAPSAFAQGAYPEDRAMIFARYILTACFITYAYLIGVVYLHWRQKSDRFTLLPAQSFHGFILVIMCFYLFYGALQTLSTIPAYQARATAWDARAKEIEVNRLSGQMDQIVPAYDSMGRIRELSDDPQHWVNRCAASYYQIDSISAQ
jgi:hypothetical protein